MRERRRSRRGGEKERGEGEEMRGRKSERDFEIAVGRHVKGLTDQSLILREHPDERR